MVIAFGFEYYRLKDKFENKLLFSAIPN